MTAYAAIVELARRELELVRDGRWHELPALQAEREAAVELLPRQAPPEAEADLTEALALTEAASEAITIALEQVRRELGGLGTHRRVAAGYAQVAPRRSLDAAA